MNINGAIFDLDGTLLDSMYIWERAGSEFLLRHGVTPPPGLDEIIDKMTLEQSAQYFIQTFALPMSPGSIVDQINSMVETEYALRAPLKGYVLPLLEQLARDNVPACIATVTDRHLVQAALKRLGIYKCFQFVITCADVGKSKLEPDIYLQAAKRLGTAPGCTMVYEDSLHCIETAKNAGFITTGVFDRSALDSWEQIVEASDFYIKDI